MEERVSVPVPAPMADWLKREAARQERPVAFVVRRCIEAAQRDEQHERAA